MRFLSPVFTAAALLVANAGVQAAETELTANIHLDKPFFQRQDARKIKFDLVLNNFGSKPAKPSFPNWRLTLNGVVLSGLDAQIQRDLQGVKSVAPGASRRLTYDLTSYVGASGPYSLAWGTKDKATLDGRFFVQWEGAPLTRQEQSVVELTQRIRRELPAGWDADYDPVNQWIQVERFRPTGWWAPEFPSQSVESLSRRGAPHVAGPVHMTLKLDRFLPPAEYQQKTQENEAMQVERAKIKATFKLGPGKGDTLYARTPDQRAPVERYNVLGRSMHQLPDFYFENVTFRETFSLKNYTVPDAAARTECAEVARRVRGLLTAYRAEPGPIVE